MRWSYSQANASGVLNLLMNGKSPDAKLGMYRAIVDRLGRDPGVRPEDVLISVVETGAENWSFGNGEAQLFKGK
ncbi:tautomerase family protein [Micromonospora sp. NPDC049275]|uniref:tautomerase family protein n=1 Tax=Micromonospora sp. NPDC049275 TaxID=3364268 RepID=UPI0037225F09